MENEIRFSIGGAVPIVPPVDAHIDPAKDFYTYVNHGWQRHIHLPPYEDSFGVSEEIELEVRTQLMKTLERLRRSDPSDGLSILATSFLHTASQRNSVLDLQKLLNTFDCMKGATDIGDAIGRMNKLQSNAPLSLVVNSDNYDSSKCCLFLYEPSLGLPSKHYYTLNPSGGGNRVLRKYIKLLHLVGAMMNIESLETAVTIEAEFLPLLSSGNELTDMSYSYNPHSVDELMRMYKHIPWVAIFAGYGMDSALIHSTTYIVTNVKYMTFLDKMFRTKSLDVWRTLMRAQVILSFLKYLPPPFDDMHYDLFEKAIKGIAEKLPQKNLTLQVCMTFAPQDLSRVFVREDVAEGTKRSATALVQRLKEATRNRLMKLAWMSERTRAAAITKVDGMSFAIGFPSKWTSETAHVALDATRPLQNIWALASADTAKMIRDLADETCRKTPEKWTEGAFEVNAYYYPEGNMMVVPAGILRPPFFDLERSIAWNLGGIGAAIGHEITHGFDDDGRLYDENGNYNDWWTDDDARTYKKMSKAVVDLFDGQKYMGGKINGKLTLSENLADLGGLAIALEALHAEIPTSASEAERRAMYREFFTSYAVSWRQKDRPKKAEHALLLDRHAPPIFRVNLIVRQFQEFYDAFDIPPTSVDYIPPELRIVFW